MKIMRLHTRLFLLCYIKAHKLFLRIKLLWLDFLRWGARNRLSEIDTWERIEIQDQWERARKKWLETSNVRADDPHNFL